MKIGDKVKVTRINDGDPEVEQTNFNGVDRTVTKVTTRTIEWVGVVTGLDDDYLSLKDHAFALDGGGYTFEVLEEVEDPWQEGDVIYYTGNTPQTTGHFRRNADGRWDSAFNRAEFWDDEHAERSIKSGRSKIIIRGGKVLP